MPVFLRALRENGGNISAACREVAIGRTTFYDYKDRCEAFQSALKVVLGEKTGPRAYEN